MRSALDGGPSEGSSTGDGRRARRDRNRSAVLDAAYKLVEDGNPQPSFEDVALASGVSLSSVYRYFSNHDELMQATVERRVAQFEELFRIPDLGVGSLDDRLEVLVRQRLALWAAVGPAVPVIIRLAPPRESLKVIADRRRRQLRRQVELQLAPELKLMDGPTRAAVTAAADTLCQFEGIGYLRRTQTLSDNQTRETLLRALRLLLDGARAGAAQTAEPPTRAKRAVKPR